MLTFHAYSYSPLLRYLFVCLLCGVWWGCAGQGGGEPIQSKPIITEKANENIPPMPIDTIPLAKKTKPSAGVFGSDEYKPKQHRNDIGGGYFFVDSLGEEVSYISHTELIRRNPYSTLDLPLDKKVSSELYGYLFSDLTQAEISWQELGNRLPTIIKNKPSENILKRAGYVLASLNCVDYYSNNQYLVVAYSIAILSKGGKEIWVETTVQTYNKVGNLISTIVTDVSILSPYISADGHYILADHIGIVIGDGVSDDLFGSILLNVEDPLDQSKFDNLRLNDASINCMTLVEDKFLFYGFSLENEKPYEDAKKNQKAICISPTERTIYYQNMKDIYIPVNLPNVKNSVLFNTIDLKSFDKTFY